MEERLRQSCRSRSFFSNPHKSVCQLEGSDHGGRDSAAELALAGTIDVQTSGSSCNRLTLVPASPNGWNYTPPRGTVNGFVQRPSLTKPFSLLSTTSSTRFSEVVTGFPSSLAFIGCLPATQSLRLVENFRFLDLTLFGVASYTAQSLLAIGQVAQLVERGPEKAGVGGSIPSLATNTFNNLAILKRRVKISRACNTRTSVSLIFTFGAARLNNFPIRRVLLVVAKLLLHRFAHSAPSS